MAKAGLHLIKRCEICGKEYRQSRVDQKYCSSRCGSIAWRKRNYPYTYLDCEICGTRFLRISGMHKYCSSDCRAVAEKRLKQSKNSGAGKGWSAGKIFTEPNVKCDCCGKEFHKCPTYIKRNPTKNFCSQKCRTDYMGTHPEHFPQARTKRANSGKREDLNGLYVRSAWEANYARYLNWLVGIGEIKSWRYEPKTFEFSQIKKGSRFYTPDFEITNNDNSIEYHEIKGYMDQRSATKLKRMAKYYPDVKVVVVDKDAYQGLAKSVRSFIPEWE